MFEWFNTGAKLKFLVAINEKQKRLSWRWRSLANSRKVLLLHLSNFYRVPKNASGRRGYWK